MQGGEWQASVVGEVSHDLWNMRSPGMLMSHWADLLEADSGA